MEEELKKQLLGKAFVDFGNGFKFIVDDIEINHIECYGDSILLKVHPKSLDWVEIENKLKNYDKS